MSSTLLNEAQDLKRIQEEENAFDELIQIKFIVLASAFMPSKPSVNQC
jgi:hypothetical protein